MTDRFMLMFLVGALLLSAHGCAGDDADPAAPGGGDGGVSPDATAGAGSCPADHYTKPTCGAHPSGPHGSKPGEVFGAFSPALKDCNLKPVTLQDISCGKSLLLVSIGAGWCQPCIDEMKLIEKKTHEKFCGRGLGIVSVIFQDERQRIPTSTFCGQWRQRFGLTFPVLLDQLQQTKKLMDYQTGTPLNLLLDARTMKILFRWSGEVPKGLNDQIEQELKKLGK